jgi:hypothetical protein
MMSAVPSLPGVLAFGGTGVDLHAPDCAASRAWVSKSVALLAIMAGVLDGGVSVVEVREVPPPRTVREWIAFAILKTCTGLTLLHGLSMVVSIVPVLGYVSDPGMKTAAYAALWISIGFLLAGGFGRYLARTSKAVLPNERLTRKQSALGVWVLALVLTLVALPPSTFQELAPLRSLWRDMIQVLQDNHVFEGVLDSPQFSGVILAPVGATLLVPMFELLTAVAFAGSSVVLLLLLWARSFRFTRAYLICLMLQGALVFSSLYGADLAGDVARWVAKEAGTSATHMRTTEVVEVLNAVQRYDAVLHTTGFSLLWTFVGYVLWMPVLLRWPPALETFAVDEPDPAEVGATVLPSAASAATGASGFAAGAMQQARARPQDVAGLSPAERRAFYEQAARQLQSPAAGGPNVTSRRGMRMGLVWAAIGVVFMMFAILRAVTQVNALNHPG